MNDYFVSVIRTFGYVIDKPKTSDLEKHHELGTNISF